MAILSDTFNWSICLSEFKFCLTPVRIWKIYISRRRKQMLADFFSPALIVLLCLLPLSLAALGAKTETLSKIEPVTATRGKLNISVDPRLELLAVLQHLSGSAMTSPDSDGYAAAADAWFAGFKDHPALAKLQSLETYGFNYDLAVSSFLRFDGVPLERQTRDWTGYAQTMNEDRLETAAEGGSLEEFYAAVNDFVRVSDFRGWFESRRQYFTDTVAGVDSLLSTTPDLVAHLIAWYGYEQHSYNLAISPLLGGNGYGPALVDSL
ncbi:MAG: DUF4932 domain-containing protein, partial [Candidatus Cloacimonetes bacterium]|nr:DUF4932 domain-containing protein [Candidatus Cloacimonadota bacterium]